MSGKKVLLIMPTFWDTIAPPVGIVSLKSFLERFGHEVKSVNLNAIRELWSTQNKYFDILSKNVKHKRLIPRLGTELLGFHMNAAVFREDMPTRYKEYIVILVKEHFAYLMDSMTPYAWKTLVDDLDNVILEHFKKLMEQIPGLVKGRPEYVGCTCLSSTLGTALYILREIKKQVPQIKAVLGGPGPYAGIGPDSMNMKRLAEKCYFVDKIIFGEGEKLFKSYLEGDIGDSKIVSPQDVDIEPINMDELPNLDYSDLDLDNYFNVGIGASRGCPFMCAFCSEAKMWGNFRKMSSERVVDEIQAQTNSSKKKKFYFTDSLLNHSLSDLCEKFMKNDMDIQFDCYLRIDKFAQDQSSTDLWAKAGLSRVRLGMESGSTDILKVMNKKITPAEQAKALKCLGTSGIRTTTYWIVGHPYETEENFQETLALIRENKDFIYELDLAVFYFYGDGEIGLGGFVEDFGGVVERFPSEFLPLSIFKYYKLKDLNPTREEAFERAIRFAEQAEELGIPFNPATVFDYMSSERRWEDILKVRKNEKS